MRKILHVENLDCPVCAEALQGDIQKIKGVSFVAVDYLTQTITLDVEGETVLSRVVKTPTISNRFVCWMGACTRRKAILIVKIGS